MIPPPLMQDGAYEMNQTVINSELPRLLSLINRARRRPPGLIDVFTAFGGVADWRDEFPASCTLNSSWPYCPWYCDAQSCAPGQCHPNDVGCAHLAQIVAKGMNLSRT